MSAPFIDARRSQAYDGLACHRLGSLFSSLMWIEVLARTYGLEISASTAGEDGDIRSAILFSYVSDLKGDRIVSLPFSDYCDPLVDGVATWRHLIQPVLDLNVPVTLRCLRSRYPTGDDRFMVVGQGVWHGVDLTRSEDELWAGLPAPARRNIRTAQRNGVVVREAAGMEDVHVFHRMHCHVRKSKYRLLAQPIAFFENLHESFTPTQGMTVLFAELEGDPIAGILFLECNRTLYYKFNASVDQTVRPNDLLIWEGIRMGRRRNLERLDFGFSDIGQPGLVHFKRKYATKEQPIVILRWQPPGYSDPRGEQAGRTVSRMAHLLTDPTVPDEITRVAGNELYRFFC